MDYPNTLLELYEKVIALEKRVARLEEDLKNRNDNSVAGKSEDKSFDGQSSVSECRTLSFDDYIIPEEYKGIGNEEIQRRDSTKYIFEGGLYKKNRLVLAVVQSYVKQHGGITREQLKEAFPKLLQGSLGVVEKAEIARMRGTDYERRYFTAPQETIRLRDGDMYVCSQWGIFNLPQFLIQAKKLGFEIRLA